MIEDQARRSVHRGEDKEPDDSAVLLAERALTVEPAAEAMPCSLTRAAPNPQGRC
ncbi:MAG: hypothetical protein V4472_26400 [Pseudomonadota bacterium]